MAQHAEACRKSIALAWLGQEMPDWSRPCPIRVKLTGGEAGGLTSFGFDKGRVLDQEIELEGRLDRVLASALAARDHAHGVCCLFRRPDAALGG